MSGAAAVSDSPRGFWQGFVAASCDSQANIRTLASVAAVGPLVLSPTGIVRCEPDADSSDSLSGFTTWRVSSPVSVDGGPHDAPYAPLAGPAAVAQVWRVCGLLALDIGGCWWPLGSPAVTEWTVAPAYPLETTRASADLAKLSKPAWSIEPPAAQPLATSSGRTIGSWVTSAWDALDEDPDLDDNVRTFLTASRLLESRHLLVEAAMLSLVAILDGRGKALGLKTTKERIEGALRRSYARHYCPDLRSRASTAAGMLFKLIYDPGRNILAHEARLLHLDGPGAGPLGDKPRDLDPDVHRMNFSVVDALANQARYVLRDGLGVPGPEPGRCVHTG